MESFDGVTSVITPPNRDFFDGVNRVPRDLAKPGSILTGHSLKQIADKPLKIAGITRIRTREIDVDLRDFPAIETVNSRNFRMDPCPHISHRHAGENAHFRPLPTNVSASASCAFELLRMPPKTFKNKNVLFYGNFSEGVLADSLNMV